MKQPTRNAVRKSLIAAAVMSLIAASAIAQRVPPQPPPPPQPPAPGPGPVPAPAQPALQGFGAPLAGLNAAQLAAFNEGRAEFVNVETPEGGLGPIFNGRSCVECHSAPAVGGGSATLVTRFGRTVDGEFDPLESLGGSLLQRFAIAPAARETIPHEANTIAQRQSTPLFGLGLIEAIPDAAIYQLAATPKPDGVKGRVGEMTDITTGLRRAGRFGWKAQQATLLAFSADAYLNEMGITNRFFPKENAPNGNQDLLARFKRTSDPEDQVDPVTGKGDIDVVADYMRFLAAPPALARGAAATAGETAFFQAGCQHCHTPTLQTGVTPVAALSRKSVALYSDLLLHDMGSLGDGIAQAGATGREIKTPPLWGLRASAPYLHDGRATTIDAAIRAHDGEGSVARDRYVRMPQALRQNLVEFLGTL
jgi:CxxC motif-containing protein (DUF1111 family)